MIHKLCGFGHVSGVLQNGKTIFNLKSNSDIDYTSIKKIKIKTQLVSGIFNKSYVDKNLRLNN